MIRAFILVCLALSPATCSGEIDPEQERLQAEESALLAEVCQCFWDDSAFKSLQLETTACYGKCPVYSLTIFADGRVKYEGFADVAVLGTREAQLEDADMEALHDFFREQIIFFNLEDEYRYKLDEQGEKYTITDQPSTFLTVKHGSKSKRVENYYGAPESLDRLEALAKELASVEQWVNGVDASSDDADH